MGDLLADLTWRGLIAQSSDRDQLAEHLAGGMRTIYCGFDPTADSLHIGHLVPLMALRRAQLAGHRPILLIGGATGLIGDPSFRDDERVLNAPDIVADWVQRIRAQVEPLVDFEGTNGAVMANNLDWTQEMDVITYLRDVGKHFSVNAMIQRDSVRARLDRDDQGISYTEFSYMLLQSMDFLELARRENCTVQFGGSDQWGNIVSGCDLVRRVLGKQAFALTLPLATKADGTKFGKTASGAVWLDGRKTSPYAFYQFWLNTADADVESYLKMFTLLGEEEITGLAEETAAQPQARAAQKKLASALTQMVHGAAALASSERITSALFGGAIEQLTEDDLAQLALDGMDASTIESEAGLLGAVAEAGLTKSVGEARKLVRGKGLSVNGSVVEDERLLLEPSKALFGRYFLIRKGKKNWHLAVIENSANS